MKIILTVAEIKGLVARELNLVNKDFVFEIAGVRGLDAAAQLCLDSMKEFTDSHNNVLSHVKIAAIKELRNHFKNPAYRSDAPYDRNGPTQYLLGLADAKYAVENFAEFVLKVTEHGRLPLINRGELVF